MTSFDLHLTVAVFFPAPSGYCVDMFAPLDVIRKFFMMLSNVSLLVRERWESMTVPILALEFVETSVRLNVNSSSKISRLNSLVVTSEALSRAGSTMSRT